VEKQISIITPVAARSPSTPLKIFNFLAFFLYIFISYLERASCYATMYSGKSLINKIKIFKDLQDKNIFKLSIYKETSCQIIV